MRLLVNAGARTLHLFHSQLGWQALQCHAPALAERMRLFVSIFCVPPVTTGVNAGYAQHSGLCFHTWQGSCSTTKAPRRCCRAVRRPARAARGAATSSGGCAPFRGPERKQQTGAVGGRLDMDKRPDLLRAIAERLPALRFHVYGRRFWTTTRNFGACARSPTSTTAALFGLRQHRDGAVPLFPLYLPL